MTDDTTFDIISPTATDSVIRTIRLAVEANAISPIMGDLTTRYVRVLFARVAKLECERDEALARVATAHKDAAETLEGWRFHSRMHENEAKKSILTLATDAERDALAEVRRQERERCAMIALSTEPSVPSDPDWDKVWGLYEHGVDDTQKAIHAAIRNMEDGPMKTLIDRLRYGVGDAVRDTALMNEAADRIGALEAEKAQLERDLAAMVRACSCNPMDAEIEPSDKTTLTVEGPESLAGEYVIELQDDGRATIRKVVRGETDE